MNIKEYGTLFINNRFCNCLLIMNFDKVCDLKLTLYNIDLEDHYSISREWSNSFVF